MANDLLEKLLHEVALGKINVKDAKKALEGIDLEKDDFQKAVDFGVFTEAEPGTVINATISPSGGSALVSLIFIWGIFWITYWSGTFMYGLMNGWGPGDSSVEQFKGIWATQIRYAGVGAMVVGGLYTLWSMRKSIITGISKALKTSTADDENLLRTEIDLPMRFVFIFCSIIVGMTLLFYWWKTGSLILSIARFAIAVLVSFVALPK